jgi:RNA polymerase sigma-70 factor (ECF subfamily)
VAKKMPEFRYEPGRDSFKGWLLQIVRWKVVDQVRRRHEATEHVTVEPASIAERLSLAENSDPHGAAPANLADPRQDLARLWEKEWERHLLMRALARVKRKAKPEQYAIYHLYVTEEKSVGDVRRTLGVSSAQVYLAKHRVGALLKKELRSLQDESC